MLWTSFDMREWIFGVSFTVDFALHIGPLRIGYAPMGSQLYRDFKRIREKRDGGQ